MSAFPLAWLLLSACGPYEDLKIENAELHQEVERTKLALEEAERERDTLAARVERLQKQLESERQQQIYRRLGIEPDGRLTVSLETSRGTLECELLPQYAPMTVLNFVELAEGSKSWTDPKSGEQVSRKLYDGTLFHRVIPEFMIQGGDPLGSGKGGPGYRFEDEIVPELTFSQPGMLAMANSGPNTNGSQFFITEKELRGLDGDYTIFGRGCTPLSVVEKIARSSRDKNDKPKKSVRLKRVLVRRQ